MPWTDLLDQLPTPAGQQGQDPYSNLDSLPAPGSAGSSSFLDRVGQSAQAGLTETQDALKLMPSNPMGAGLMGMMRFLTPALQPLQLPADALKVATNAALTGQSVGGALQNQFGDGKLANYLPFGTPPAPPPSGRELVANAGITDPTAQRWLGAATDLFYDPLLFGSYLGVGAKLARMSKLPGVAESLDKAAATADKLTNVPKLIGDNIPPAFKQAVTGQLERAAMLGMKVPEDTWEGFRKPWGEAILPGGRINNRDALQGGAGRPQALMNAQADAVMNAQNLVKGTMDRLDAVRTAIGKYDPTFFQQIDNGLKDFSGTRYMTQGKYPQIVQDALMTRASRFVDERAKSIELPVNMPQAPDFVGPPLPFKAPGTGQKYAFDTQVEELKKLAVEHGVDPNQIAQDWKSIVGNLIRGDVAISSKLSMVDPLRYAFKANVQEALTKGPIIQMSPQDAERTASEMWGQALRGGLAGEDVSAKKWNFYQPEGSQPIMTPGSRPGIPENTSLDATASPGATSQAKIPQLTLKFNDMLGELNKFPHLELGTLFNKLGNGHLRRTYAMFIDFDKWKQAIKSGDYMPSRVIDDGGIYDALASDASTKVPNANPSAAGYLRDYLKTLEQAAPGTPLMVRQSNLANYFLQRGLTPDETSKALATILSRSESGLAQEAKLAGDIAALHARPPQGTQIRGAVSTQLNLQRENLAPETLNRLGEMIDPLISLSESGKIAGQTIPTSDFLQSIYNYAKQGNFIADTPVGDNWVRLPENATLLGPMAGKFVDPYIKKEIFYGIQGPPDARPTMLRRMQSGVSGLYLAGPSTRLANNVGNFFLAMMSGEKLGELIPEYARTLRDWKRQGDNFTDLKELQQHVPLFGSIHSTELLQQLDTAKWEKLGGEPFNILSGWDKFWQATSDFAKAPFGQKWLGNDAFRMDEDTMRLATYRLNRNKAIAQGVDPLQAQAQAAEKARTVTFDYSALPDAFKALRNNGVWLFPGFPYFVVGRTLKAAYTNPGTVAAIDRIPEAIWDGLGPDTTGQKHTLYASLDPWMRDPQQAMVPLFKDAKEQWHVIPLSQLIPQHGFLTGNNLFDTSQYGGIYRPLIDMFTAYANGDGKATLGAKFGQKVFLPTDDTQQRLTHTAEFLWNNFAPTFARNSLRFDPQYGASGLVPALANLVQKLPPGVGDTMLSANELQRRRADKDIVDGILGFSVRQSTPIATNGPLANIQRAYHYAQLDLKNQQTELRKQFTDAYLKKDTARANQIQNQMVQAQQDFAQQWQALFAMWNEGQQPTNQPAQPNGGRP